MEPKKPKAKKTCGFCGQRPAVRQSGTGLYYYSRFNEGPLCERCVDKFAAEENTHECLYPY